MDIENAMTLKTRYKLCMPSLCPKNQSRGDLTLSLQFDDQTLSQAMIQRLAGWSPWNKLGQFRFVRFRFVSGHRIDYRLINTLQFIT